MGQANKIVKLRQELKHIPFCTGIILTVRGLAHPSAAWLLSALLLSSAILPPVSLFPFMQMRAE